MKTVKDYILQEKLILKKNIVSGGDFVDLGLPSETLWAVANVGAHDPWELGDYYMWGETEPKKDFTWSDYKYGKKLSGGKSVMYKYNEKDNLVTLEPEDDVVTNLFNGNEDFHIPTVEQIKELFTHTNIRFVNNVNNTGVKGWFFDSKVNGKRLFIPVSGLKISTNTIYKDELYILSNEVKTDDYTCAKCGRLNNQGSVSKIITNMERPIGCTVRGVKDKK
jgi:hypothetical protein